MITVKRQIAKTALLLLTLIAISLSGCQKCLECTGNYLCVSCYKGSDTTKDCFYSYAKSTYVQDHIDSGYECKIFGNAHPVIKECGQENIKHAEANGAMCE